MNIQELIINQLERYSKNILFENDVEKLSYGEVLKKTLEIASLFKSLGIQKNHYVIYHYPTDVDSIIVFYASQIIGAIFVPINKDWSSNNYEEIIKNFESFIYIGEAILNTKNIQLSKIDIFNKIQNIKLSKDFIKNLPLIQETDISTILFTSGTTGSPKGVILSHETLYKKAKLFTEYYKWKENDILLSLGEINTIDRLRNGCIAPLFIGNSVVSIKLCKNFLLNIPDVIFKFKCTITSFTPTIIKQLNLFIEEINPEKFQSLRMIGSPASLITKKDKDKFENLYNKKIYVYYGLTEIGGFAIGVPLNNTINDSFAGFSVSCEVKIIDDFNNELPFNEKGELIIKSDIPFMIGYLNNKKLTNDTIKNGWIYTSDLASKHENGTIQIYGRKGDVFKNANEELIFPIEIESVLTKHPSIFECCVLDYIGDFGETRIAAIIIINENIDNEKKLFQELKELAMKELGKQKVPTFYKIVDIFPKTNSGKIKRKELKEQLFKEID